jgi:hypothetical protein
MNESNDGIGATPPILANMVRLVLQYFTFVVAALILEGTEMPSTIKSTRYVFIY